MYRCNKQLLLLIDGDIWEEKGSIRRIVSDRRVPDFPTIASILFDTIHCGIRFKFEVLNGITVLGIKTDAHT